MKDLLQSQRCRPSAAKHYLQANLYGAPRQADTHAPQANLKILIEIIYIETWYYESNAHYAQVMCAQWLFFCD